MVYRNTNAGLSIRGYSLGGPDHSKLKSIEITLSASAALDNYMDSFTTLRKIEVPIGLEKKVFSAEISRILNKASIRIYGDGRAVVNGHLRVSPDSLKDEIENTINPKTHDYRTEHCYLGAYFESSLSDSERKYLALLLAAIPKENIKVVMERDVSELIGSFVNNS